MLARLLSLAIANADEQQSARARLAELERTTAKLSARVGRLERASPGAPSDP